MTAADSASLTGFETVMWQLERDPRLGAAFANLSIFDRPPDRDRLRQRMATAAVAIPRLRQRIEPAHSPLGRPRWVTDEDFDLDRHLRWVDLGGDATLDDVYAVAATLERVPFDRLRPPWEFVTIEGLADGRAAMLQRLHHTITDGEGGIRLSLEFIDMERDPPLRLVRGRRSDSGDRSDDRSGSSPGGGATQAPTGPPSAGSTTGRADGPDSQTDGRTRDDAPEDGTFAGGLCGALGGAVGAVGSVVRGVPRAVGGAVSGVAAVGDKAGDVASLTRSTLRQAMVGRRRSPLWTERSLERWFGTTAIWLDDARAAAHHLDGSVNDFFVAGAARAAGRYHELCGEPVPELRVSIPISTRHDRSVGGNAFSPTQVLISTDAQLDVAEHFTRVHGALATAKGERVISAMEHAADLAAILPAAVVLRAGQHFTGSVDFVCSNVRAAPFDLYIAGAWMQSNYPIGPLAGTAFNMTTMSYRGWLFIGLVVDPAAVQEPELLHSELGAAYDALLTAGGVRQPRRWIAEAS